MGLTVIEMPENYNDLGWRRIIEDDPSSFPDTDDYLLLSISNFSIPIIGRCEGNENDGYTFYEGDDNTPLVLEELFVNAWMPLPKKLEEGG